MSRYTVRPLRPDDFDLLMGLEQEMFGDDEDGTLGFYYVRLCCEFFGDSCFLLEAGGEPAGYLLSVTKDRASYCTTLALRPKYQGSRAVVKLIRAYIGSIVDRVDVCWFTVEPGNEAARALHRMLGAEEVGVRENFYGPGRHRIVARIDRPVFERVKDRFAKLGLLSDEEEDPSGRSADPTGVAGAAGAAPKGRMGASGGGMARA